MKKRRRIYISINDAELKQVKNCETARDIWLKLESVFESKVPAKKAFLWRRLMTHRLKVNGSVRGHIDEFFDIVNKLSELNIEIADELQSIMLLYSLPESFDNFRCAIESRNNLFDPEALKIKILDEDTTRTERTQNDEHNALFAIGKRDQNQERRRQIRRRPDRLTEPSNTSATNAERCDTKPQNAATRRKMLQQSRTRHFLYCSPKMYLVM